MQFRLFSAPESEMESALRGLLSRQPGDAFLKFLSANDVGATGSHQSGLYLPRESVALFLAGPTPERGENLEAEIFMHFRGDIVRSRFVWYGKAKSEARLTRVHRLFGDDPARLVGSLFVLVRMEPPAGEKKFGETSGSGPSAFGELFSELSEHASPVEFRCWIFEKEDEIEAILDALGITPAETNRVMRFDLNERLLSECTAFAEETGGGFPSGDEIASRSRRIYERLYGALDEGPDEMILNLIEIEYSLFRFFERLLYAPRIRAGFERIEDFLSLSLELHNRRKSRAGQSLELHLKHIFERFHIACEHDVTTSDNRRPDFLFPSLAAYETYRRTGADERKAGKAGLEETVFFLAAKTTCKDRWRQILTEAPGLSRRYLFTLQQAVSSAQLREMGEEGVIVVLPESYRKRFPEEDRIRTISLREFLERLRAGGCQRQDLFSGAL